KACPQTEHKCSPRSTWSFPPAAPVLVGQHWSGGRRVRLASIAQLRKAVGKPSKPFNNPFAGLKLPEQKRSQPATERRKAQPIQAEVVGAPQDEGALFRAAVGTVQPVRGSPKLPAQRPQPSADSLRDLDPDADAFAELCELVAQRGPLDLTDSDEYIEGHAPGLDARILRRLRGGHYSIQGHIDLHGLTREEAKKELDLFIEDSHRRGRRTVLVVHGRGLHSKDQIPVLKSGLQVWLSRGRIGRHVLAFTSAQRHDGGVGAVYVLLRR